jgi:hypothetical protein
MRGSWTFSLAQHARLLCTQNPFYVLSAVLVLYGLRQCFAGQQQLTGGWLLMGLIAGYTLLLAAAAWVIVRFAKVWDDARTVMLLVVLMFLALSVSFDEIALNDPYAGADFLLVGLAFAVLLTEILLAALGIRLPAVYRVPYYVILLLMFVYPLALAWLSVLAPRQPLAWGVYLFPWASAAAILTLLPAARWGRRTAADSGTPWRWPLYPWSLFVFLLVCLALRSYSLSYSFEATQGWRAEFQPYFLVPMLLAAAWVLLELAIASGNRWARGVATVLPLGLAALAFPGHPPLENGGRFLALLCETMASPVQLTLAGAALFHTVAWLRGVKAAGLGWTVSLLLLGVVGRETLNVNAFTQPQPWVLEVVALAHLGLGLWRKQKPLVYCGAMLAAAAIWVRDRALVEQVALVERGYFTLHLSVLVLLLYAYLSDGAWARWIRVWSLLLLPAGALVAATLYESYFPGVDPRLHQAYILGLTAAAWGFWHRAAAVEELYIAVLTTLVNAMPPTRRAYVLLEDTILQKGLMWLTLGLALLALALVVTLWKGGLLRPIAAGAQRLSAWVRRRGGPAASR